LCRQSGHAATFSEPSIPIVVIPAASPRESQGRWFDNADLANLTQPRIGAPSAPAARLRGMTTDSKTVVFAPFPLWTQKQINGLARGAGEQMSIAAHLNLFD
jgi:hypothetical protein